MLFLYVLIACAVVETSLFSLSSFPLKEQNHCGVVRNSWTDIDLLLAEVKRPLVHSSSPYMWCYANGHFLAWNACWNEFFIYRYDIIFQNIPVWEQTECLVMLWKCELLSHSLAYPLFCYVMWGWLFMSFWLVETLWCNVPHTTDWMLKTPASK